MPRYLVRLLGPDGAPIHEEHLDFPSDDHAIDQVGHTDHPHGMEIWDGQRQVAAFPAIKHRLF